MKKKLLVLLIIALSTLAMKPLNAANIQVTNLLDTGTGSLRWAIGASSSGDIISFSVTGTIVLTSSISWNKSLTILGPGINNLTIDGNNATFMFNITGGKNIIRNIAFAHGSGGSNPGCIYSPPGSTSDTTVLEHCSFRKSTTTDAGGAVHCSNGRYLIMRYCSVDSCTSTTNIAGGIVAFYGAILENSTFSNCSTTYLGGAAWIVNNVTSITNCTFVNNTASYGGAIHFQSQSTVTLVNNTFSGNTASNNGGAIYSDLGPFPGNMVINFKNNVFSSPTNNYAQASTSVLPSSMGGNVSNDASMAAFFTATNDKNITNPLLSAAGLQNNGGITRTVALTAASPAINNGIVAGAPLLDQRDYYRNGLPDAGSYEYNGSASCDTYDTITETACFSYTSPSGEHTWTSSNTYLDTIPNAHGCDSIITIHLTIKTVNTGVFALGTSLVSLETAATWQWVDCNNGFAPLSGQMQQSFTAIVNGNYAVIVSKNGCVDTSSCYLINNIGIEDNSFGNSFTIYPNPTYGKVSIDLGMTLPEVSIVITNVMGQMVSQNQFSNTSVLNFDMEGGSGVYFLTLTAGSHVATFRIMKR